MGWLWPNALPRPLLPIRPLPFPAKDWLMASPRASVK
jgi:hypothetical protein